MKYCPQCQQTFDELENVCPEDGTVLYLQVLLHLVGCTIAKKYVVEQLAGVGGMSAVYRAYHREMERPVALKILLPHLMLNDPDMVRMFEREARAAGQINHPNVATIYDTGRTAEDMVYLFMEWLEGHTLEKIIRQNAPLNWETTALLLEQIAAGLTAANQCRIIHRDLKPGNIMALPNANGSMQVKILDFGIAKIAANEADNYVSTAVGTVHYASPEQMIPGNAIDARADLFALGVMIYEMLTGRLPFEENSIADLIRQHLLETPMPLSFNHPDAPVAIVELVEQMLANKPVGRPASAQEIWSRFEQARRAGQPWPAFGTPFTDISPTFGPLLLALNGDTATAKKLADEIAARHPRHTLYQSLWLPLTRAAVALQARKPDESLQQLQQLDRQETASHLWAYWLGAQAHLQKKQPEKAARLLQRLQTNAGLYQLSVMRPLALLGLAQAAQQMNDKAQSIRNYLTFFVQWETADTDLPVIKAARAARATLLAKLEPKPGISFPCLYSSA